MATNKNNVNDAENNLFILAGQEDEKVPYDYGDMPTFEQNDKKELAITVRFRNEDDFREFASMMDQTITPKTKAIWYPAIDRDSISLLRWIDEDE